MLIVITMFAVLGAYYLSDVLMRGMARAGHTDSAVVLLAADTPESMWSGVMDVRGKLPELPVVIVCPERAQPRRLEPGMRGVRFVSSDGLAPELREALHLPENSGTDKEG